MPGPNAKSISVLDKSKSNSYFVTDSEHDHVTFYTWQSKSKSGLRLGKSNPSLILDLATLNPSLILDLASLIQV